MKSTLIWLVCAGAFLLVSNPVALVGAWNRQIFDRYSRNLLLNSGGDGSGNANTINNNNNHQFDELSSLFGIGGDGDALNRAAGGVGVGMRGGLGGMDGIDGRDGSQQGEVYGIVEPLPCVDRSCSVNDDCCPGSVCTYGDGKCVFLYGRKRDFCHRNADCEPGMACVKATAGNMVCQAMASLLLMGAAAKPLNVQRFGDECVSSSDCNLEKGMCCQLQRSHHGMMPAKMCAFFRDPFMCIDIMPTEDEDIRESRFLQAFAQKRM